MVPVTGKVVRASPFLHTGVPVVPQIHVGTPGVGDTVGQQVIPEPGVVDNMSAAPKVLDDCYAFLRKQSRADSCMPKVDGLVGVE